MADWAEVRKRIRVAIDTVQEGKDKLDRGIVKVKKYKVLDKATASALSAIPDIGPSLLKYYEKVDLAEEDKADAILFILENLLQLNEKEFHRLAGHVIVNLDEIIKNQKLSLLFLTSAPPPQINTYPKQEHHNLRDDPAALRKRETSERLHQEVEDNRLRVERETSERRYVERERQNFEREGPGESGGGNDDVYKSNVTERIDFDSSEVTGFEDGGAFKPLPPTPAKKRKTKRAKSKSATPENDISSVVEDELAKLSLGQILFNPPQEMQVGKEERIEVRISKSISEDLSRGLRGRGVPKIEEIKVGTFMTVILKSERFKIKPLQRKPEQLVAKKGFTQWEWDVIPLKSGTQILKLVVTIRIKIPNVGEETKDYPVFERHIKVKVNRFFTFKNIIESHWMWIIGTMIAIAGLIWKIFEWSNK